MPALKGAGAILSIGSAVNGSAIAISAATQANPCVLTTATNTFTANEIGVIAGVGGMVQLNSRAFKMNPVGSTSATLSGVDATAYGAYTAGGTVQGWTMVPISNVADAKGFQGQAPEIDVTNLLSVAKEIMLGLQDFGSVDLKLWLITSSTDPGQAMMRTVKATQVATPFSLQLSDGSMTAFMGFVKQFGFDGVAPEAAVSVPAVIRVTSAPAWFS